MSVSFPNSLQNIYTSAEVNIEYATNFLKKTYESIKNISSDTLFQSFTKVKNFIENNYSTIFFAISTLLVYKYAFFRFIVPAVITLIIENKFKQPEGPIISTNNLSLNIIGAVGLVLHKITYPFSNPLFYFAPILSGYSFAKTMYALYRSHFPVINQ
jgi:hypothetical protein